jgi:hypothetical protein
VTLRGAVKPDHGGQGKEAQSEACAMPPMLQDSRMYGRSISMTKPGVISIITALNHGDYRCLPESYRSLRGQVSPKGLVMGAVHSERKQYFEI